jgi:cytochrome c-type protein NapB
MRNPVRKTVLLSVILASLLSLPASAVEDQAIPDDSIGLSKTSVYDVPDPAVYKYGGGDPGTNKRLAKSYYTAPPMIPHSIKDMTPITRSTNLCKDCHVQPEMIGTKLEAGMPVPAPASHYVSVKKGQLYMGRWNCIQCHRPQAKVDVLVQSTFKKDR